MEARFVSIERADEDIGPYEIRYPKVVQCTMTPLISRYSVGPYSLGTVIVGCAANDRSVSVASRH